MNDCLLIFGQLHFGYFVHHPSPTPSPTTDKKKSSHYDYESRILQCYYQYHAMENSQEKF